MRKFLNIIGYISLILIPFLLYEFFFVFHDLVKNVVFVIFLITVFFQIIHFIRTKTKCFGIRILILILTSVILGFIIYNVYGIIKNNKAKDISNTIDKITFGESVVEGENIINNLRFVNRNDLIFKGSSEAKIYYKDGTIEDTRLYRPSYIIEIKNEKYYIDIEQ